MKFGEIIVRRKRHEVIFSPPHHSDLQPIELVWAVVKGVVGRQYCSGTTMSLVLARLQKAFHSLSSSTIKGCIGKANKHLETLYNDIMEDEAIDEPNEEISEQAGSDDDNSPSSSDSDQ